MHVCSFPALLQELEESKADLGVDSYGLSVTTLEEVFLAVSAAATAESKSRQPQPQVPAAAAAASEAQASPEEVRLNMSAPTQGFEAVKASTDACSRQLKVRKLVQNQIISCAEYV